MIETIMLLIIVLLFIDYYHKKYRMKQSIKKVYYRNSHSYYDDTDYSKYKPYREIYTYKILIAFLTVILIVEIISQSKRNNKIVNNIPINIISTIPNTPNEIKQQEIAQYYNNYTKKIDELLTTAQFLLLQKNFENCSIAELNSQIKIINTTITKFANYKPKELENNLYQLDVQKLNILKNRYEIALKLKDDYYNNQLINSFNSTNHKFYTVNNNYRIELIRIFNEIKMNYKIEESGEIRFTYKDL